MCTPVGRLTRHRCPKKLPQSDAVIAESLAAAAPVEAVLPRATAEANSAAAIDEIFMGHPRDCGFASMLFGDVGCADGSRPVSPTGSHVGAERGDLFIVQADAELESAHLGPRPGAVRFGRQRAAVRSVQNDVDERGWIRRLQYGAAGH